MAAYRRCDDRHARGHPMKPRPGPTADDNDRPPRADETPCPGVVLLFSAGGPVGRAWPIADRPLVIGRGAPSGILGDDDRASCEHAEIAWDGSVFRVRDLGSRNGTFVGG